MLKNKAKNISQKVNLLIEEINSFGYNLEGEDEELVHLVKKEKYKLTSIDNLNKMISLICKYVKAKLSMSYNLTKIKLSSNITSVSTNKTKRTILVSNNFMKTAKLLIIFPDREMNHYGVFSKTNLLFKNLRKGSMRNYMDMAADSDYSVLLGNQKTEDHYTYCESVWSEIMNSDESKLKITNIVIVAHKLASLSVFKLINKFGDEFISRIKRFIFINSPHNVMYQILSPRMRLEFENKCTNFIQSTMSVGTLIYSHSESMEGCENRSCGTVEEEMAHFYLTKEISKYL